MAPECFALFDYKCRCSDEGGEPNQSSFALAKAVSTWSATSAGSAGSSLPPPTAPDAGTSSADPAVAEDPEAKLKKLEGGWHSSQVRKGAASELHPDCGEDNLFGRHASIKNCQT